MKSKKTYVVDHDRVSREISRSLSNGLAVNARLIGSPLVGRRLAKKNHSQSRCKSPVLVSIKATNTWLPEAGLGDSMVLSAELECDGIANAGLNAWWVVGQGPSVTNKDLVHNGYCSWGRGFVERKERRGRREQ